MAMLHSNPESLPAPPALKGSIVVHFESPNESGKLVCFRCAMIEIKTPRWNMEAAEPFLHLVGSLMPDDKTEQRKPACEFVIPCRFVTEISKGPEVEAQPSGQLQKILIAPEGAPPSRAMPHEKISEAIHQQLTTSIGTR
jgi:hypothetical protein